ncbi:MAG: lactonase family protein [Sutterellaceae bacterium]|nr:lactonase family protein [Sutterellaceae bacterium]
MQRRLLLQSAGILSVGAHSISQGFAQTAEGIAWRYLLVSNYGSVTDETVHVYRFDMTTGQTQWVSSLKGVANPPFMIASKNRDFVYTVGDTDNSTPTVYALAFDRATGRLRVASKTSTVGSQPFYVALSQNEKFAVTANYKGTSISVVGIDPDGTLRDDCHLIFHTGSGPRIKRQPRAHPHCAVTSPDGKVVAVPDLGNDRVYLYALDESQTDARRAIDLKKSSSYQMDAGTGPRHICFHPNGKYAYLLSEFSGRITVFSYRDARFTQIQSVMSDPYDAQGSADIHVSPDGKFLYATHRLKNDGIVAFAVDENNGTLTRLFDHPTEKFPRAFTFSPDGRFILVACRDGNCIQVFARDTVTGKLTDTHRSMTLPKAAFALFI